MPINALYLLRIEGGNARVHVHEHEHDMENAG